MNPTVQSQIVWRNQQNSTDAQRFPSRSDGNLWGSNVRRIMGILQVICGVTELAVGIAVVFVPFGYYYHSKDYAAWGLWNGVVVAYMVTSIIASVLSACCFIYSAYGAYSTIYFCIPEGQLPPPAFTHDLGTTQPSNTFHNTVSLQPTSQNTFETNEPSKL
ncbi:hypothetical protein HOLleu_36109 [Holothuria leucospilota]|uniref:Uncharacterized protein n=1 Tax=Holothuria leucospilota TaxID=206669 RepID=A0A9Q0YJR9_HOLLE|nr:hypothetical protein HOLleu_36109 [Holothuria leucospilota]